MFVFDSFDETYYKRVALGDGFLLHVEFGWMSDCNVNLGIVAYKGDYPREDWSEGTLTGPGGVSAFVGVMDAIKDGLPHVKEWFPRAVSVEVGACTPKHMRLYRRYLEPLGFCYVPPNEKDENGFLYRPVT